MLVHDMGHSINHIARKTPVLVTFNDIDRVESRDRADIFSHLSHVINGRLVARSIGIDV